MKIECYLSKKCGAEKSLRTNIEKALSREGVDAEINFHRLSDLEANLKGLKGSPAIFINGREVQPGELTGFA
jgi:hypothetical protein